LVIAGVEDACAKQAELTFAIARHAVVDLCQVFSAPPRPLPIDRLPGEIFEKMREKLAKHGMGRLQTPEAALELAGLRGMYEPYVNALAQHLSHTLPPWIPDKKGRDNWETTAWAKTSGVSSENPAHLLHDDHF